MESTSVLRKKIALNRPKVSASAGNDLMVSLLEGQVGKALSRFLKLRVACTIESCSVVSAEMAMEQLPSPGMTGLLGDDAKSAIGFVALEAALANGLIDLLTGGDTPDPVAQPDRLMTAIDRSLCAPVVDELLATLRAGMQAVQEPEAFAGLQRLALKENMADVEQALTREGYVAFRISCDLGENGRGGGLTLAIAEDILADVLVTAADSSVAATSPDLLWHRHMASVVSDLRVDLRCLMLRLRLPLAAVEGFSVGQILPLPQASTNDVRLETASGPGAILISLGDVGSVKELKAFRFRDRSGPRFPAGQSLATPLEAQASSASTNVSSPSL